MYEALRMYPPGVLTPRVSSTDTAVPLKTAPSRAPELATGRELILATLHIACSGNCLCQLAGPASLCCACSWPGTGPHCLTADVRWAATTCQRARRYISTSGASITMKSTGRSPGHFGRSASSPARLRRRAATQTLSWALASVRDLHLLLSPLPRKQGLHPRLSHGSDAGRHSLLIVTSTLACIYCSTVS